MNEKPSDYLRELHASMMKSWDGLKGDISVDVLGEHLIDVSTCVQALMQLSIQEWQRLEKRNEN